MTKPELPIAAGGRGAVTVGEEREIRALVERFYRVAREDAVLGPIFEANVSDWDLHLAKMCDFWSAVIHRSGRYAGRPLEVHRRVAEIRPEHFAVWLAGWRAAVDAVVEDAALRARFKEAADRMAESLSAGLARR